MRLSLACYALAGASVAGSALAFPSFDADVVPNWEDILARGEGAGAEFTAKFAQIVRLAEADPLVQASLQAFNKRSTEINAGGQVYPRQRGGRRINTLLNPADFKFNSEEQYVDLTSKAHRFMPPGPNDIRGPCPGLNLLANHGYINRNGITTLTQGIDAVSRVFGMGADLGLVLCAYAVIFNGNLLDLTWSIGGSYKSKSLGGLTNLLFGDPKGIEAHNVYEGDASTVRKDFYALDNPEHDVSTLHMPFFKELLAQGGNDPTPGRDVYTPELMLEHKSRRYEHSVATNPYFFNSAFGGLVVTTVAERLVAEFAANNTADENGMNRIYLDEPNLLAFFSVEKLANGELKYTPGHERLLPSWLRRPLGSVFSLADSVITLLDAAAVNPSLISLGGNAGTPGTFTGVDLGDLTGGLFNTKYFLDKPDAVACILYQGSVQQVIPSQLNGLYKSLHGVLEFISASIEAPWKRLAESSGRPCENPYTPGAINQAYRRYPGAKNFMK